jgi:hypothetical protein
MIVNYLVASMDLGPRQRDISVMREILSGRGLSGQSPTSQPLGTPFQMRDGFPTLEGQMEMNQTLRTPNFTPSVPRTEKKDANPQFQSEFEREFGRPLALRAVFRKEDLQLLGVPSEMMDTEVSSRADAMRLLANMT